MQPVQEDGWEPRLAVLSWSEFAALPESCKIIVIPVGAIEQHGHHLPLRTDAMNVEAVAVEAAREEMVLVAPTLDYGVSPNHLSYPGTISLRQQTLVHVLIDIGDSLAAHSIRGLLFLNGNGGNADAMRFAAGELRSRRPTLPIGFCDIGDLRPAVKLRSGVVYHADETETSHALHVNPGSVRRSLAVKEMTDAFLEHYRRYYDASADLHGIVSYGLPATETMSESGVMGDATVASAELGAAWHAGLVQAVQHAVVDIKRKTAVPGRDI